MVAMNKYLPGFRHFIAVCLRRYSAIHFSSRIMTAIRLTMHVRGIKRKDRREEKRREEKEAARELKFLMRDFID
jgi:hypothetical protein